MGGTLSKTKKVDFLNGPSYWKWCVWDGQCFGSFEVSLPVKKKIKIWDDTCKISTNMSTPPFSFRTRPATAALPGWCKADSSQGCCGSSPRGLVLLGENCGVIRVHPTGRLFFQGSNWFNLWPFQIKIDHRQTKWDMLALWIFSLSFQGGPPNGSPVGPFHVENVNFPSIKWGGPFPRPKKLIF